METFTIKQGDTFPTLVATLKDPSGQPVNLSNSTITFKMVDVTGVVKVSAPATGIDPSNGRVSYSWSTQDTEDFGDYKAVFEVTNQQNKKETYPNTQPLAVMIVKGLV